ncbi:hypothetical protein K470DRAFT_269633 [Piedraia hortae CBS 480.64]|uniref:Pentatricopeptide repeat-containing protein n=1 Tax=Piedraia hortae CBS 480.64 TaxID=1314780 RepID=A0A6A7C3J4_9PEZI|nr:hypothetical protein K470DRAFT_269633 [Piedraia hortae CBS 480.64]
MQSLWALVTQRSSGLYRCQCPQCFRTPSRSVRWPRAISASRLWYSSIFAVAATCDVVAKKQREDQWDRAIEQLKKELKEDFTDDLKSDGDAIEISWLANTGLPLNLDNLPPQSIYASPMTRRKAEGKAWSRKKTEVNMLWADVLQLKLFLAILLGNGGSWEGVVLPKTIPSDYKATMMRSEEELKKRIKTKKYDARRIMDFDATLSDWRRTGGDVALSDYRRDGCFEYHQDAKDLNRSLQSLFQQFEVSKVPSSALLSQIAYNMHVSPTPMDVHTWNTLLIGLHHAGNPVLVESVIKCLRMSHCRPNEVTNIAVLNHFTKTGNARAFTHWLGRIRGSGSGLMLARSDVKVTEASQGRLKVKRNGKVLQLPYPTPNVFHAIIKGVLKFSGFESALSLCEEMGREGWGLSALGMIPLLKDCARRGDWSSGLAVWQQMQALKAQGGHVIGVDAHAAMLRLCVKAGKGGWFSQVWHEMHKLKAGKLWDDVGGPEDLLEILSDASHQPGRLDNDDRETDEVGYDFHNKVDHQSRWPNVPDLASGAVRCSG